MKARAPLVLFAVLALLPLAAGLGPRAYLLALGAHTLIFALAALSLSFILGQGALVSLGHAAFLGLGAYAVAVASSLGVDEIAIQLGCAALAAAIFAACAGAISLRASGVNYIMSTLAFGQMLYFLAISLAVYGGDDGYTLPGRSTLFGTHALDDDFAFYYFALGFLAAAYVLFARLAESRFGRVLGAIRQNPLRARAYGFKPFGYRLVATLISGMVCACAGVLLANQSEFVSPAFMTWQRSAELLIIVILGGVGSRWGAVVGAIAFLVLEELLSGFTEQWRLLVGPLLIVVAMVGRGGLAGLAPRGAPGVTAPLLSAAHLCKRYGALAVTDDVSLELHPGELHALIGPNGAGKTTLINQLSGSLASDSGRILFAGEDVTRLGFPDRVRLGLARTFQITSIVPRYSALENVALAAQARAGSSYRFLGRVSREASLNAAAAAALARVGLGARAEAPAGELSHGEKRLLEIAIALAQAPRLLLLDEPFAGLGPDESEAALALLRELKSEFAILLVEHDMDAVFSLAARVSVLVDGRVLATGAPDAIRAAPEVRAAYLGEEEAA